MVSRTRLYSVSTSSDDEQKYDMRIDLQWCFPDFDCILAEVDQNEVKKEELIDIDKRILAWSNISKISQTTSIPSRQECDFVQIPSIRLRKDLRVTSSTDTYTYQDDRSQSQDD